MSEKSALTIYVEMVTASDIKEYDVLRSGAVVINTWEMPNGHVQLTLRKPSTVVQPGSATITQNYYQPHEELWVARF
jgi:hypothetical protein